MDTHRVVSVVLTPGTRKEFAAQTKAIAVDMESQTIAALCEKRGIPSLALKAISDGMDDDLSPILGGFDIRGLRCGSLRGRRLGPWLFGWPGIAIWQPTTARRMT